jgi:hypothetical protein
MKDVVLLLFTCNEFRFHVTTWRPIHYSYVHINPFLVPCAFHPCDRASINFDLLLLLWRYSPFCALASLTISLHRSIYHAFFQHVFTSKVFRSLNTEYSHLNPDLPFFPLLLAGRSLPSYKVHYPLPSPCVLTISI